jgi:putative glutathione S-transferase
VSLACPWAHRTLIFRTLKGLEDAIGLSVLHWHMGLDGWTFEPGPGVIADPIHHARLLSQVYANSDPVYTGRVTVPLLWDRKSAQIVNNESSEIIRMLNSAFDRVGARPGDFYPADLRDEIEALNARIYETVNNGVYRAGFARSQQAYDEAVTALFASLDWLDERLSGRRFLLGDRLTEADWRLFTTLIRFDTVYVGHFKCNIRRIADYPHLSRYLKELYRQPLIAPTVNFFHIKHHYYESHRGINPSGIVPAGPVLDL